MISPNEKQRVIPHRVYDAIKAQAEIHGGVGFGAMYDVDTPVSGIGLAHAGGAFPEVKAIDLYDFADKGVAGFYWDESDRAVQQVLWSGSVKRQHTRIPFDLWVKELNAVRGDDQ